MRENDYGLFVNDTLELMDEFFVVLYIYIKFA